jgi:hypothetical protein
MAVQTDILRRVRGHGRGHVFTASDFLDLGSRGAVDQALSRLARSGRIRRVDRGVYDFPRQHAQIGPLWPSSDAVVKAVARKTSSGVKVSGALAANAMGLSTQVPANAVFLTDGPSRTVRVGRLRVTLKHADRVDMLFPGTQAGLAIVALRYLGANGASGADLRRMGSALSMPDKRLLMSAAGQLTGWLAAAVACVVTAP